MLSIFDGNSRFGRRQLLSVGSLAFGGFSLASLMAARASAATSTGNLVRGRSVIFLFQQGGPSQYETFDPKPEAAEGIRTIGSTRATSIPGIHFGETYEQLAAIAHKLTIVRSFNTGNATHNIHPIVSPESFGANLGTMYSRVVGSTDPATAMPTNAVLFPQSVCSDVTRGAGRGDLTATGPFGSGYAPFVPGGNSDLLKNLRLNLSTNRFENRRELLAELGKLNHQFDLESKAQDLDKFQQQACQVLLSSHVADALDLSREDPQVLAKYDTSRFVARHNWASANRGKRGYYTGHAKSLGKSLLMARRLCEAGCGFVTVHCAYEGIWDMHADKENLNVRDGMEAVGRPFDHAVSALIADLEARGLQDKILLICTGEMGRTPRINKNGGRDHWARLAPMMLYGANAPQGHVLGQSSRDGGEPAADPFSTSNLISTILHATFDVGLLRLQPALSKISKLAEVSPIVGG